MVLPEIKEWARTNFDKRKTNIQIKVVVLKGFRGVEVVDKYGLLLFRHQSEGVTRLYCKEYNKLLEARK